MAELRESILSGELLPGSPVLLREEVERLGVSAMPVREALSQLEQRGLIERRPHHPAYVARASLEDSEDTYHVRLMLECEAVRSAATRMTPADHVRLTRVLDRYATALRDGRDRDAREHHGEFHLGLYEVAGSRWLSRVIPLLWDNSERYRRLSLAERGSIDDRVGEHRAMIDLCLAGDEGGAEAAIRDHLTRSLELVRRQLPGRLTADVLTIGAAAAGGSST